jgi:uncharacterized protein YmfQ (DUF2313 family)
VGVDAQAYARQLRQLLPRGEAFNAEADSAMSTTLQSVADELARIDSRTQTLLAEWDPLTALELLADWERVLGLPDPCVQTAQTVQERRNALVAKLTILGGQNAAYYVALAARFGFTITVIDFQTFRAGVSNAGDPLSNGDWVHTFQINAPLLTITEFKCGASTSGDPLRQWGNDDLQCVITDRRPAHSIILFAYS